MLGEHRPILSFDRSTRIFPVVGFIKRHFDAMFEKSLEINHQEVHSVFFESLDSLLRQVPDSNRPAYIGKEPIWGMTAYMLQQLLKDISPVFIDHQTNL